MSHNSSTYIDGLLHADFACFAGHVIGWQGAVETIPDLRAVTQHDDRDIIGVQNPAPPRLYMFDDQSLLPDDGNTVVKPDDIDPADPGRWILFGGVVNPVVEKFPFTFLSATPQTVYTLLTGELITDTELVIETVYDDNAATLSVGVFADVELIIAIKGNDPQKLGNYGNNENFEFSVDTAVVLTLLPGASTQGSGYVLIEVKRT